MEAPLLDLILDIAQPFFATITQYLRKDELQRVVAHGTTVRIIGRSHCVVAVVGDVEGGAKAMAALLGGIAIDATQTSHIFLGAQHTGDDDGVQRNLLHGQRIEKTASDVLQQMTGLGHQIGNTAAH